MMDPLTDPTDRSGAILIGYACMHPLEGVMTSQSACAAIT